MPKKEEKKPGIEENLINIENVIAKLEEPQTTLACFTSFIPSS